MCRYAADGEYRSMAMSDSGKHFMVSRFSHFVTVNVSTRKLHFLCIRDVILISFPIFIYVHQKSFSAQLSVGGAENWGL